MKCDIISRCVEMTNYRFILNIFILSFAAISLPREGYSQLPSPPPIPTDKPQEVETWDEWTYAKSKIDKANVKKVPQPKDRSEQIRSDSPDVHNEDPFETEIKKPAIIIHQQSTPTSQPASPSGDKRIIIKKDKLETDGKDQIPIQKKKIIIEIKKIEDIELELSPKEKILQTPNFSPKSVKEGSLPIRNKTYELTPMSIEELPENPYSIDKLDRDKNSSNSNSTIKSGPWSFGLNGTKGSPVPDIEPSQLGFASIRSPLSSLKQRVIYELSGGYGPNDTRMFFSSIGLRLDGHVIGVAYERSQWLDIKTNTGKFTESILGDYCASMTIDSSWLSIQPCLRYGAGSGYWLERNALNQVVENEKKRNVFKTYGRFIALVPVANYKLAIEGSIGYSEDVFLYGPFSQLWIKTPLLGLSVGFESYSNQRNVVSLGIATSFIDIGK